MALTLTSSAHSEIGLVRKNNQDSAFISPRLLLVADGMGGAAAGDMASAAAVAAYEELDAHLEDRLAHAEPIDDESMRPHEAAAAAVLKQALARANDHIAAMATADHALEGMGTTVCGFLLVDNTIVTLNIGDSRGYLVRDGKLHRITKDHSWVQTLVDDGRLTEAEALVHPQRSLIMRVVNGNPAHVPDIAVQEIQAGDRLMLCSDGLCGLVTDAQIAEQLTEPDREVALASLVDLAHEAGGHDNITIVIADVDHDQPDQLAAVFGAASSTALPMQLIVERPTATEESPEAPRKKRWVRVVLGILLPFVAIGGGGFGWYSYTQTRFYLGSDKQYVAIYQGVPDVILGVPMYHVAQKSDIKISDLPPRYVEQVERRIDVNSLEEANQRLETLRGFAITCVAQREARARANTAPAPTATPSLTPGATPIPGASVTPGVSETPTPSPMFSPAQPSTPEDC